MSSIVLLQQQQHPQLFDSGAIVGEVIGEGAFRIWSPEQIASATVCPLYSVQSNWPLIYDALIRAGVAHPLVCLAALGTVAVETAHTFEPVREAYWLSELWRQNNLRYYPYYGRGFVQLTWDYNYAAYGALIGENLLDHPDRAMEPNIAAQCLVQYFIRSDVVGAALVSDWPEVRRRVQGAYAGLDTLLSVVGALPVTEFPPALRGFLA